ncbi:serine/threonine-protein kinase [Corallococcus sp. AB045]|uniref:serine/threonine-protein kinase n=1 Tax=Corallococcus sp. AB045 TaxID=2316719 RepID=UPI001315307F|nr:serine/threonine-protein kinase [Corallococcus sp. AB045]
MDPLLSSQIGDFTVEERIGAGGMGVVYRATHSLIGKQAAIKVLRAELVSPRVHERLLVEARAVNAIRHPGIIDIFGFGKLPDGRPYVVMELLEGRPLSELLSDQKRLDVPTVLWMLDQILSALGAAHRAGVVHRDLKPANVFMVEPPNAAPTIKLVDFGIAKLLENRESPTTLDGSVLGTPEFMAPEQIRGGTVGPATDLYALGIMAFQMLTGARPFQGDPVQVLFAHVDRIPPLPSSRAEGIPPELDTLVLQLLAKDPALRPPSAEAVQQQLQRVPTESRTQTFARPPGLKPKASTQRPAPVPKPAAARVATRAPVVVADAEDSGTETLQTLRRPARLGWMLGGAALLVGLGAGAWWLSHPVAPTEAVPTQIAPKPETEPTKEVRVKQATSETSQAVGTTVTVPSTEEEPDKEAEKVSSESEEKGSPSRPSRTGRITYKTKVSSTSLPEPIPSVTPEPPIAAQGKATVTDVTETEGNKFVGTPAPPPTQPASAPVVAPPVAVARFARPKLSQDSSTQRYLAKQLDALYEALYSQSPNGSPPPAFQESLVKYYQAAVRAETPSEANLILDDIERWEKSFKRWRSDPQKFPASFTPALAELPKPPSREPVVPAPATPPPSTSVTSVRKLSIAEKVTLKLEQLAKELRSRTGDAGSVPELESQLQQFHTEANAPEQTSDGSMALLNRMDAWLEKLKARFPR